MQPCGQYGRILTQRLCQLGPARTRSLQFFRIAPQRGDRGADGQRLTVAIGDQPTMRRDRDMPNAASVALPLQERLIHDLQVDDPPGERAHQQCQQGQDQAKAPGVARAVEPHGATNLTSAAAGICIFS